MPTPFQFLTKPGRETIAGSSLAQGLLKVMLVGIVAVLARGTFADIYQLRGGGRLAGHEEARTESGDYVIQTPRGARVTLSKSQIQRIVREDDRLREYAKRAHAIPDTASAHRQLAKWCQQRGLKQQAAHHLRRVIELDPEDEAARRSLGYQRVGKQWLTRKELMAARGMHFYEGTYRTAQDIALRKRARQREEGMREWHKNIKRWLGWLTQRRGTRAAEAREQLTGIHDPLATPALLKFLERQGDPQIRALLISILAQIDSPLAMGKLVDLSLVDPDPETRLRCLEYLLQSKRPLSLSPYIKALRHSDNEIINRAGVALREIGDPGAISPLIDALVTTHKFKLSEGTSGQMNASMSSSSIGGGGGGFSFGGGGPKIEKRALENRGVHRALVKLAGEQDFGYDKIAWRHWLVNRRMRAQLGTRRDD